MKKMSILVVAVLICVLLAAGCAPAQSGGTPQVIEASASASQSAGQETSESTLSVNASATVKAAPDIAYISIGVRTTGSTAEQAQQENAKITNAFLEAVQAQGVAQEDLETSNINVYTDYDDPDQTVMENTYRVTIRDVDKVGAVIDAATAAGANSTYGLSFDVQDRDALYIQALGQAMESVGDKAKTVAMAGGYTIVRPLSITEAGTDYRNLQYETAASMMDDAGSVVTPVTPQEIEITASISGTYVIA